MAFISCIFPITRSFSPHNDLKRNILFRHILGMFVCVSLSAIRIAIGIVSLSVCVFFIMLCFFSLCFVCFFLSYFVIMFVSSFFALFLSHSSSSLLFCTASSNDVLFLVACTRLYTPLCPSVRLLVGRSVVPSYFYFFYQFYFLKSF